MPVPVSGSPEWFAKHFPPGTELAFPGMPKMGQPAGLGGETIGGQTAKTLDTLTERVGQTNVRLDKLVGAALKAKLVFTGALP
jgi:hypothetical protein